MGTMFAQLFAALTAIFSTVHRTANAANHLAGWAEASAATFEEEAAILRKARHTAMLKEHNVTVEQLAEQATALPK